MPDVSSITCPECGTPFFTSNIAGESAYCEKCGKLFPVPIVSPDESAIDAKDGAPPEGVAPSAPPEVNSTDDTPADASDESEDADEDSSDESIDESVPPAKPDVLPVPPIDLNAPPPGARFEIQSGGFVVSVSARSNAGWIIAGITGVWGFLWIGALLAMGRDDSGKWDLSLVAMLSPFMIVTLVQLPFVLYLLIGRCTVSVTRSESSIFRGVGPIGRRVFFEWDLVREVVLESTSSSSSQPTSRIKLIGPDPAPAFGGFLSPVHRGFLAGALKQNCRRKS